MAPENLKKQAEKLIDDLPDDATWEDLMYKIYVRQAIEKGLVDSEKGNTIPVENVRKKFDLDR